MFIDVVSANTIASLLQGEIDERKRERKGEPSVDSTSFACRLCSFLCYSCRRVRQGVGIRGDRDTFVLSSTVLLWFRGTLCMTLYTNFAPREISTFLGEKKGIRN